MTAGKPTEAEYNQGVQDLQTLMTLSTLKHIDLYFADESGFSRLPQIPYGWLPKGKQTGILSDSKRVMNVFGLMSLDQKLYTYPVKGTINSDFICQALDDFCSTITLPTVVVLDQATWHTAASIQDRMQEWQSKNLFLFFLPKYSPHLNAIEILWRKIKYKWLKPKDYLSEQDLKDAIFHIFQNFGKLFQINFSKNFYLLQ